MGCNNTPKPPYPAFNLMCPPNLMDGKSFNFRVGFKYDGPQYRPGNVIQSDDTLFYHVSDWCALLCRSYNSDMALDHLKKYIHKHIDKGFDHIRNEINRQTSLQ